jgi:uncharacterized protein
MSGRAREYLILHGMEGNSAEHWQEWLKLRLSDRGEVVHAPDLPKPYNPRLAEWLETLRAELDRRSAGERVVICHSLACALWLHHAVSALPSQRVDRVLLVAPPSPALSLPEVRGFVPAPIDPSATRQAAVDTRIAYGSNDPYCPEEADGAYVQPLGVDADRIDDGGHLNTEAGYGPWPSLERWCLDPSVRIGSNRAAA